MNKSNIKVLAANNNSIELKILDFLLHKIWLEKIFFSQNEKDLINQVQKELFDLIIINIPFSSADSIDLAKQIKSLQAKTKVIGYTAYMEMDIRDLFKKRGVEKDTFDAIIYKPCHNDNFQKKILEVLNNDNRLE
jgi:CheY-like chemotaxis protein